LQNSDHSQGSGVNRQLQNKTDDMAHYFMVKGLIRRDDIKHVQSKSYTITLNQKCSTCLKDRVAPMQESQTG
jgi:hypothetical protein